MAEIASGGGTEGPESQNPRSLRLSLHTPIWAALLPVRTYVNNFPIGRGKGLLHRWILKPSLPPEPATFPYKLPHGSVVRMRYRESFGMYVLMKGSYEAAEIAALCNLAKPGTVALDVGGNMGLYALELSAAVGPAGRVISFEPNPGTAARLRGNLDRNGIRNVTVMEQAVGRDEGIATLNISDDDALSSIAVVPNQHSRSIDVKLSRLDTIWRELGSPAVSVLKIDVEGGEHDVLLGSDELLRTCRPAILTEAWTEAECRQLSDRLVPYGYEMTQPAGFSQRDYIFVPNGEAAARP